MLISSLFYYSIDDELMEVDLHNAHHRLVASSTSRQSSGYQIVSGLTEPTPSPEHKSQCSQQLQGRTHRRSLSKCTTSSFEASSTTLTTVDALLNASYEFEPAEDRHEMITGGDSTTEPMAHHEIASVFESVQSGTPPGSVKSPLHESCSLKSLSGTKGRPHIEDNSSNSHKAAVSYAQYLLQPACDFQEEITGEWPPS